MWLMGVDTEPIFDEFILNFKSIDTDSHFDVLFKIIQDFWPIFKIIHSQGFHAIFPAAPIFMKTLAIKRDK